MGRPPKPSHLRQRTNKKAGATTLELAPPAAPRSGIREIPNPDGREWHPLTVIAWAHAWASPMASQFIETDADGLGRLALLWDELHKGDLKVMSEIRLQEQRFGLSPLDRSRLQWEFSRGDEAETRTQRRRESPKRTGTNDPRLALMRVK